MEIVLEILKAAIPALIVVMLAYFMLKAFFDGQKDQNLHDIRIENDKLKAKLRKADKKILTPIRLQAYERMILYLDRIAPQSLVFRAYSPGQTCIQFQAAMLKNIRDEFEHNLSQQLYISKEAWALTKTAKEEIVSLINKASAMVRPDDPATELSKHIFAMVTGIENLPTDNAINQLKNDIQKLF